MLVSVAEYSAMQEIEEPTELVRGVVVRKNYPYVAHGLACANLCWIVGSWHKRFGFGTPIGLHGVITRRSPDSVRSIDLGYYNLQRFPRSLISDEYRQVAPEFAFEVRAHDECWFDMAQKVKEFLEAGTSAFWSSIRNTGPCTFSVRILRHRC